MTDPVKAKLTIFNGGNTILVFVLPDLGPTFVTVGKIIHKKDGPYDYTLDFKIPPIKTLPSAPDASVGTVDTNTPKKTIKKGKKTIRPHRGAQEVQGHLEGGGQLLLRGRLDRKDAGLLEVQEVVIAVSHPCKPATRTAVRRNRPVVN